MLALGIISASLAVLGLGTVIPAYLDPGGAPRWVAGLAAAELSAISTGAVAAAEHFGSTAGTLGTGGAGAAGLVLLRMAQTGWVYSQRSPQRLPGEFFDKHSPLPHRPKPIPRDGEGGCRARLIDAPVYERYGVVNKVRYLLKTEAIDEVNVAVRARLDSSAWIGISVLARPLMMSIVLFADCEKEEDGCNASIQIDGPYNRSDAPLHFALEVVEEKKGRRTRCNLNVRACASRFRLGRPQASRSAAASSQGRHSFRRAPASRRFRWGGMCGSALTRTAEQRAAGLNSPAGDL
jgi:hypothetical protein